MLLDQFINWADSHPGAVAILVFVLGVFVAITGYFFKKFIFKDQAGKNFTQKQKSGDNSTNSQAGRDINVSK